jgi:hypothetical protein
MCLDGGFQVIASDGGHASDGLVVERIEDINPRIGDEGFSVEVTWEVEHEQRGVMTESLRVESWKADSIRGLKMILLAMILSVFRGEWPRAATGGCE